MDGGNDVAGEGDLFHVEGAARERPATADGTVERAPDVMVPHQLPGGMSASPSVRFTGMAIGAVVLAAALMLLTLPQATRRAVTPLATSTPPVASSATPGAAAIWSGSPLPAFRDWRAAYLGLDGALHAVATDGTHDAAGPVLSDLDVATLLPQAGAEASLDGHLLAYMTPLAPAPGGGDGRMLVVTSVRSQMPMAFVATAAIAQPVSLFWSPDSAHLAFQGLWSKSFGISTSAISLIDVKRGSVAAFPPAFGGRNPAIHLAGWIDAAHLAVLVFWPATPSASGAVSEGPAAFGALDIATGAFRPIATLPAEPFVFVAPDGARALVQDTANPGMVEMIDTMTGQVRQLSTISHALGGLIFKAAWQPDAGIVAVNTIRPAGAGSDGPRMLLLDVAHDQASQLASGGEVLGWAPGGGPLLISAPGSTTGATAANALRAVSPVPGRPQSFQYLALTQSALIFLGFMRTA